MHAEPKLVGEQDVVGGVVLFGGRDHAGHGELADALLDFCKRGAVEPIGCGGIIGEKAADQCAGCRLDILVLKGVGAGAELDTEGNLVRGGVKLGLVEPVVHLLDLFFLGLAFPLNVFQLFLDCLHFL